MRLHQVVTVKRKELICRELSCHCEESNCSCHNPRLVSFNDASTGVDDDHDGGPNVSDQAPVRYLKQYVIVEYDGRPYPGIVESEDADAAELRCMHRAGANRFYWLQNKDICWCSKDKITAIFPPPTSVTGRHMQVDANVWDQVVKRLN